MAQVSTRYKIGKLSMWTLFCNVCIDFLNSQIWMEIMLELNGEASSVTTFSTDFSFQNLVFWEFIWIVSGRNHLKNPISPTFWIQILPNKFHSILPMKIFPTTPKAHSNFSQIFSYDLFSFSGEEIIQYSRTFASQVQTPWNQAHAPLLIESFPKTPRTRSEASRFDGSHNYKTNYLPS